MRSLGPTLVPVGLVALSVALLSPTSAQTAPEKRTLARTEDPVVVLGARLPRLKGIHKDLLRLFASREGKVEPIPFQVDERTPELNYCWTSGTDAVKDVDEGRVDDDDELVFMARDAGDRAPELAVPGATAREEIELRDPRTGARGWAYAFAFTDPKRPPPAGSSVRYASLSRGPGGDFFRGDAFEIACTASAGLTGRPTHVRLRDREGRVSRELVTDAARGHLHASYLFVHVDRDGTEARTSLGGSWIDGPVRVVAPVAIETYLVWGNWITAVRSVLFVTRSRWDLRTRIAVPVNLDGSDRSDAWFGLELAPDLAGFSFRNDHNPAPLALAADVPIERLDRAFPAWNVVFGPEGSIVSGLRLDPRLASGRDALHFEAPRAGRGAEVGFAIDLTGLKRTDDASPYEVESWVGFSPASEPIEPSMFADIEDAPLVATVR